MIKLKYGNTNTFYIPCTGGGLLVDTDYAGTLPAFYKAIKQRHITVKDITYVLATHYHPDHMGLVSELMEHGVRLLLPDVQKDSVHFSDELFRKDGIAYTPIDASSAAVITCGESRDFLLRIGISGEIIHTESHSADGVCVVLDDGDCIVGDLDPFEYMEAYPENGPLKKDWERILSLKPNRILYAHRPERLLR